MAPKSDEILRKRKEAKQKKMLLLLAPVLVILIALQAPKLMKGGGDEATETTAAATTTAADPAAAPAAPVDPTAAPPPSPANAASGAAAAAALPDTDPLPVAGAGQLASLTLFASKDPFKQLVKGKLDSGSADDDEQPGPGDGPASPVVPPRPVQQPDGPTEVELTPEEEAEATDGDGVPAGDASGTFPNTAIFEINGENEEVVVGNEFPANDQIFALDSIKAKTAKLKLVAGAFSSGAEAVLIDVGETLTLVSQPDGRRYTIRLLSVMYDAANVAPEE